MLTLIFGIWASELLRAWRTTEKAGPDRVKKLEASLKWMPKLMSEGICMCFDEAIVQSMFKHVPSENGPLVLILQRDSQIFIAKHIH